MKKFSIKPTLTNDDFHDLDKTIDLEDLIRGNKELKIIPVNDDVFVSNERRDRVRRKPGHHHTEANTDSKNQFFLFHIFHRKTLSYFCFGRRSKRLGLPFISVALLLLLLFESWKLHFQYNVYLLLTLEASLLFPYFPDRTVRPQLCLALLTLLSFCFDIFITIHFNYSSSLSVLILFIVFSIFKALVFWNYLLNIKGGGKVRKYLDRRLRLFYIPLHQPRRIMRDVRGRFLALGWLQSIAVIGYVIFFVIFYFYYDYKSYYFSHGTITALTAFLSVKSITSFFVFSGLLYDTDIRLNLWYFGCFGFTVDYIRSYIRRRMKKLGGFPLVFAFYPLRFYILCILKLIDILWGLYGWIIIIPFLVTDKYYQIDASMIVFLSFLIYFLAMTDIYFTTLFGGIRWLLRRLKAMDKLDMLDKSDDSEIEEFNLLSKNSEAEIANPLLKRKPAIKVTEKRPFEAPISNDQSSEDEGDEETQTQKRRRRRKKSSQNRWNDGRIVVDDEEIDIFDYPIELKTKQKSQSNPILTRSAANER